MVDSWKTTLRLIKNEKWKTNSPQKERKITQYNLFYFSGGTPNKEKDKLPSWKFCAPLHHLHDNAPIGVKIFKKQNNEVEKAKKNQ